MSNIGYWIVASILAVVAGVYAAITTKPGKKKFRSALWGFAAFEIFALVIYIAVP